MTGIILVHISQTENAVFPLVSNLNFDYIGGSLHKAALNIFYPYALNNNVRSNKPKDFRCGLQVAFFRYVYQ